MTQHINSASDTDIHALDLLVGRFVSISEGPDGMAGWVVEISDKVTYEPDPRRAIVLDYGYGYPVGADTEVRLTVPPADDPAPAVTNPVEAAHQAMHEADGDQCLMPDYHCRYVALATASVHAFRVWQMKQQDAYWKNVWVAKAKAFKDDPCSVGEIFSDARCEGAPAHILEAIQAVSN